MPHSWSPPWILSGWGWRSTASTCNLILAEVNGKCQFIVDIRIISALPTETLIQQGQDSRVQTLVFYFLKLFKWSWFMTRLRTSVSTNDNYNIFKHTHTKPTLGTSPVIQWLRLCVPNAGGLGSIPSGEARSQRSQLGVLMLQLKIPHATTKTWHSQINK